MDAVNQLLALAVLGGLTTGIQFGPPGVKRMIPIPRSFN